MNFLEDALSRFPEELRDVLTAAGERPFRAKQIFQWIHQRGVFDALEMTDLSRELRERLHAAGLKPPAEVSDVHESRDGTRKLLLTMGEGARVECVIIPMTKQSEAEDADAGAAPDDDEEQTTRTKVTLCISTQFGCAMGCVFCASGQAGLIRGLRASEVVSQVHIAKRYLREDETLSNLVFMGMGEPLHHYDETARAIRLLSHPDGLNMSLRRITVSTVGLIPGIKRLGADFGGKVGLAISVHASNAEVRDRIVPMNRKYPLSELIQSLRDYPLPKRRRITIEYTLIDNVNDARAHAQELSRLLKGIPVKINLIPMNPIAASELHAPKHERVVAFQQELSNSGYSCFVRTRRGDEVAAACGQLAMADDLIKKRRERDALRGS